MYGKCARFNYVFTKHSLFCQILLILGSRCYSRKPRRSFSPTSPWMLSSILIHLRFTILEQLLSVVSYTFWSPYLASTDTTFLFLTASYSWRSFPTWWFCVVVSDSNSRPCMWKPIDNIRPIQWKLSTIVQS